MKRRDFLKKTAALAALGPGLTGCQSDQDDGSSNAKETPPKSLPTYQFSGSQGPQSLFSHGVASGDPLHDSVILWTRITLDDLESKPLGVEVFWEIATDSEFKDRVNAGVVMTDGQRDWTVKVDAGGLSQATRYHYRFWFMGRSSTVGATKTAPAGEVDALRFGVCSCSRYSAGLFIGYRELAAHKELDAVLHLGDYMYESDRDKGFRPNDPPHKTVTLSDYRRRYARQRTDTALQSLHGSHPMIAVWDDHETANNSYRDGTIKGGHDPIKEGPWAQRKAAGIQAWHEWMPNRDAPDRKIWRHLAYGDLCDLVMLDTRLWGRDKPTTAGNKQALADAKRSLMGMDQEAWLAQRVTQSQARWVVIGQQVMCAPLMLGGVVLNTDQWDGYQASRKRLSEAVDSKGRGNVVMLTGDIHSSWANEVVLDPSGYKPGSGEAWAIEFVAPGITSSFPTTLPKDVVTAGIKFNPHVRWFDFSAKGFYLLHLSQERVQADWYLYTDIKDPQTQAEHSASWYAEHGKTVLHKADKAAS